MLEAWRWGSSAPGYQFGPWELDSSDRLLNNVYFLSFACTGAAFICRKRLVADKAASKWIDGEDLFLSQKCDGISDGESSQSSLDSIHEPPLDYFRGHEISEARRELHAKAGMWRPRAGHAGQAYDVPRVAP